MPLAPTRVLAAALLLAAPAAALAGVVIEGKDDETPQRIVMEGEKLRIESLGKHALIFDGASKRTVQVDIEGKTYTEFTSDDFAKMKAFMQRSGAAQETKVPATAFERTGRSEQALGKRCDVYRVVQDGEDEGQDELCVAPFGAFGVDKSDFSGFRAMAAMASDLSGGSQNQSWGELPGVPLIAWEVEDGQRRETFRASKVEKRRVPASEFTVPAGFQRMPGISEQMKQLEGMQQGKGR